jgi:hypothetical protein
MRLKAVIFAATIFGASFFVTSDNDNNNNDQLKEQAVDVRKIKIPAAG